MASSASVAIVGIVTSGVVGPTLTSWATRRAARKQFVRDRAAKRRDELAQVIDSATVAASLGVVRLREMGEAKDGDALAGKTQAWAEEVFSAGQRLALRLGSAHPVVTSYIATRDALVEVADRGLDHDQKLAVFERQRDAFVQQAREALAAPISDKEDAS